jgi:hypothetical protein
MTTIPIIDLIAGMIFIYFLMSIISNAIFEGISSLGKIRAKMLEKWIRDTLPHLANTFLNHTLVNGVSLPNKASSYMLGKNFSMVLLDAIAEKGKKVPQTLAELSTMIDAVMVENKTLLPEDLKRALQLFIVEAQQASNITGQLKTEFDLYHERVEKWFDSMMERVGGGYKRKASNITFFIALIASFALNMDSISIAKYLYANQDAREKLAAVAYAAPNDSNYKKQVENIIKIDTATQVIDSLQQVITHITHTVQVVDTNTKYMATFIPVGWNNKAEFSAFKSQHKDMKDDCGAWMLFFISKIFGILITVFATCLGAPFWFDVLGKVANLRSSIKPLKDSIKN